eukprot:2175708-Amphidinium_carterae.1
MGVVDLMRLGHLTQVPFPFGVPYLWRGSHYPRAKSVDRGPPGQTRKTCDRMRMIRRSLHMFADVVIIEVSIMIWNDFVCCVRGKVQA